MPISLSSIYVVLYVGWEVCAFRQLTRVHLSGHTALQSSSPGTLHMSPTTAGMVAVT